MANETVTIGMLNTEVEVETINQGFAGYSDLKITLSSRNDSPFEVPITIYGVSKAELKALSKAFAKLAQKI